MCRLEMAANPVLMLVEVAAATGSRALSDLVVLHVFFLGRKNIFCIKTVVPWFYEVVMEFLKCKQSLQVKIF